MNSPVVRQATTAPRTLLLIHVFNHALTLRGVVENCLKEGFPVLVVDDGSTDKSLDTVSDLPIARHRFPESRGKGSAIRKGAALAAALGYSAVITLDADGRHDAVDANRLLEAADGVWPAIVVGAPNANAPHRFAPSGFGIDCSNFWIRLECGKTLPDAASGYCLYPVDFLTRRFISRRNTLETEALVRGAWAGLPILFASIGIQCSAGTINRSPFQELMDNARLIALHIALLFLSLTPWHRRHASAERVPEETLASLLHPVRFFRQLCLEHSSPAELAAATWVGIFIGALPIIPFGIATIVYVCHRLHLNKLAGVGASNVCIAPFVPFLCIEAGHFMRHGEWWTTFTWHTLLNEIHFRVWEWLLGSLIVGPLLGALGAVLTYTLIRSLRIR